MSRKRRKARITVTWTCVFCHHRSKGQSMNKRRWLARKGAGPIFCNNTCRQAYIAIKLLEKAT